MKHVVGLSGGKDSTALALKLRQVNPNMEFTYLCTPTGDEPDEMFAHWKDLERRLGSKIHMLGRSRQIERGPVEWLEIVGVANYSPSRMVTLSSLIDEFNALPNWRQRWCTRILKIEPTIAWLAKNAPVVMHVGLRADEEEREGIYGDIPGVSFAYEMRDEWEWLEADVWRFLAAESVRIPQRTDCKRCYGQRLIEWKRLYLNETPTYMDACGQETKTGATFRSPGRDTWPAGLVQLSVEFDKGRKIRGEDKELSEDQQSCRVCRL